MEDITQKIQKLIENKKHSCLADFDFYKKILKIISYFPAQSLDNQILITLQDPDATYAMGKVAWQERFDKDIKQNEKPISVLLPEIKLVNNGVLKKDDKGHLLVDAENNNIFVYETMPTYECVIKPVNIYDIRQTTESTIDCNFKDTYNFERNVKTKDDTISFEDVDIDADYDIKYADRIVYLKNGISDNDRNIAIINAMCEINCMDVNANYTYINLLIESCKYMVLNYFNYKKNIETDMDQYSFVKIAGGYRKQAKLMQDNTDKVDYIYYYLNLNYRNIINQLTGQNPLIWDETAYINDLVDANVQGKEGLENMQMSSISTMAANDVMLSRQLSNTYNTLVGIDDNAYNNLCSEIQHQQLYTAPAYQL